jgi:hypothetical protein
MRFRSLTPDTELRLHLAKAREYWRADRLDLAVAAMKNALRVGLHPGDIYDFQRTIEAEYGARTAGRFCRVAEHLILETDPDLWRDYWQEIRLTAQRAVETVSEALAVRWGKPVLLTLIPKDEWVEFMHARYGYYAGRMETHKICLPPSAVYPPGQLRRAVLHESAHAAVHSLAGEEVSRWLDEGVAIMLEGGSPDDERRRYRIAVKKGRLMTLDEISAGFESYETEIGSPRSLLCYAGAGDFVGRLASAHGLNLLRSYLAVIGTGRRADRAFRDVFGLPLHRAEAAWHEELTAGESFIGER